MGYILPQNMSEVQFALFIAGESCQVRCVRSLFSSERELTVALPQHCGSACGPDREMDFSWMVRFCCSCGDSQYATRALPAFTR